MTETTPPPVDPHAWQTQRPRCWWSTTSRASSIRCRRCFEREGLRVTHRRRAAAPALDCCASEPVAVLLTDLLMPGMSGMDLLKASRSVSPETETILMTAYGTVENAVEAMKQGAYDFVTKPIKRAHVRAGGPQGAGEADAGPGEPLAARAAGRRAARSA